MSLYNKNLHFHKTDFAWGLVLVFYIMVKKSLFFVNKWARAYVNNAILVSKYLNTDNQYREKTNVNIAL